MKYKLLTVGFLIYIGLSFLVNGYSLANYYINDLAVNNQFVDEGTTDSKLEYDYVSNVYKKMAYVDINGAFRRVLGQHELNGVVKLKNDHLVFLQPLTPDETLSVCADETKKLSDALAKRGIEYMWFTLPYGVDKYVDEMPAGDYIDYGNDTLDNFTAMLDDRGIRTVDLRDVIHAEGKTTYDYIYKTDHHWTSEGVLWAVSKMVAAVDETCGIPVDDSLYDIDNYDMTVYKNKQLGSCGTRTGQYFAGKDDFTLITPKFDTLLQNEKYGVEGTMPQVMMDVEALATDASAFYTYEAVNKGKTPNYEVHNPNASQLRVLVIGDSMSLSEMPYISLAFSDVYCINSNYVDTLTEEFLDEYQPDIVISTYHLYNLYEEAFAYGLNNEYSDKSR